jgi:DNA-binding NtrC family response regulator
MPRILVVEDEDHIRLLVTSILWQKGYDVVEATTGREALSMLREESNFDAIITDLRMPKTDVLYYIDLLKHEFPSIPLIIMSAHITSSWAKDAVKQGAACMVKPFTRQQLLDCVGQVLV